MNEIAVSGGRNKEARETRRVYSDRLKAKNLCFAIPDYLWQVKVSISTVSLTNLLLVPMSPHPVQPCINTSLVLN
jgi:hypothetical protein